MVRLARKGLSDGKCAVIGLQSTGEARTLEQLEQSNGELSGFISTAKLVHVQYAPLTTLITFYFNTNFSLRV